MRGVGFSGESQEFFIRGRLAHLRSALPAGCRIKTVLDFGCGLGATTALLAEVFPGAHIVGTDAAEKALAYARAANGSQRISFCLLSELSAASKFDLCHTSGVFHHIEAQERLNAIRFIYDRLAPSGYFALFENNPWNPGTRVVMSRIPFDREAKTLSPLEARRLMLNGGFRKLGPARSLFYFPRALSFLRFAEPWLAHVPLGAQYCVIAIR